MTCEELLQALNEHVDGTLDLSALECQNFVSHLADCNPCQIVVDNIRQTISFYQEGEPYPIPPQLQSKLNGLLRQKWDEKFGRKA